MIGKLVVAGFLFAHAAIHLGFVAPRPPVTADGPAWPFEIGRSWVLGQLGLDPGLTRILAVGLVALTIVAFAFAGLSAIGLVPAGAWPAAIAVGAVASSVLLVLFFHPWLVLGVGIDIVLLWLVLAGGWRPQTVIS